jgi:hypothetical protein
MANGKAQARRQALPDCLRRSGVSDQAGIESSDQLLVGSHFADRHRLAQRTGSAASQRRHAPAASGLVS